MQNLDIKQISIRSASKNDLITVFNWINDKNVRENSFYQERISIEEHTAWFQKRISSESEHFIFILEVDSHPAGYVRFDKDGNIYVISVLVDNQFRGKGYSKKFIRMGILKLRESSSNKIEAFIKPENIASIKSFEGLGFVFEQSVLIKNDKAVKYKFDDRTDWEV